MQLRTELRFFVTLRGLGSKSLKVNRYQLAKQQKASPRQLTYKKRFFEIWFE